MMKNCTALLALQRRLGPERLKPAATTARSRPAPTGVPPHEPLAPVREGGLRAFVAAGFNRSVVTVVVILGWLIVSMMGFARPGPGFAASPSRQSSGEPRAAEPARRPILDDVPELEKPLTYTETKIPLGELVQK